jgi:c-di-GMP-binding flagellar brake protein YcgR
MSNEKIQERKAIINKLTILQEKKCPIKAKLSRSESLTTSIIGINVEEGTLMLAYNEAEPLNKKMIVLPQIEFSAVFQDIHVAFTGVVRKVTCNGKSVFMIYIPGTLNWCNRRKHSRLKVPVADSVCFCEIVLETPAKNASEEYRQHYNTVTDKIRTQLLKNPQSTKEILINLLRLDLYDISQSGCAILNHDEAYSFFLTPERTYENCKIVMPNKNELLVSFQVVSKRNIKFQENNTMTRFNELVGVKFLKVEKTSSL